MRVVVINHSPARHLAGAELSLLALLAEWNERRPDLEVHVVSPSAESAVDAAARDAGYTTSIVESEGWVVFDIEGGRWQQRLRDAAATTATRALTELLAEVRPDLVITNTIVSPWGAIAADLAGIPHVWFAREFPWPHPGFHLTSGREATLERIAGLSDLVVANSMAVRDDLASIIPEHLLAVGYPPVSGARLAKLAGAKPRDIPFVREGALRVMLLGRVTRAKGHARAIDGIAELARRGYDVELCIVGGVVLRGYDHALRTRARRLGIEQRVRFLGEKSNPFPYLAQAHVTLIPSDREAFGRVTIESMLLGIPPIASATGGSVELIVTGETGGLFDPDDPVALADQLEPYARDHELARRHGQAAKARAEALLSGAYGAEPTIRLLESAVTAPRARAAGWRLEETDPTALQRWSWSALALGRRGLRRVGRLLRDPRPALQRRWINLTARRRSRS